MQPARLAFSLVEDAGTRACARWHHLQCRCPGPTDTQLLGDFMTAAGNPEKLKEAFRRSIPLGRIGDPGDLPGAICFFPAKTRRSSPVRC